MNLLRNTILATLLLCTVASTTAHAQARGTTSRTWIAAYGLMYTNLSRFFDPGSDSDWVFDDNVLGLGAELQREVTQGLLLGADFSVAWPEYERRLRGESTAIEDASGKATVVTAMANGRVATGGATQLGFYLTGAIGTIAYRLEDIGEWNSDFALRAGTGLEYRMAPSRAGYLEWSRIWGYHEKEGLGGGSAQHSVLRLGLRFGL